LRTVWTGATPSTLKKRNRIYGLLRLTIQNGRHCWSCWQSGLPSCRNLTETQICQIHMEAVNELRKYLCGAWVERESGMTHPERFYYD
jgi:hypothetical protein